MSPPPRPPPWEERLGDAAIARLSPRVRRVKQPEPPAELAPFERRLIPRAEGGHVDVTYYPVETPRGFVLLAPPWVEWGQAYFHRRGRIEALREAGYAALSFDLAGFGRTSMARAFRDRDVEAALSWLEALAEGRPLHVWGVSSGGYWAHIVLARRDGVSGAMFEDVSLHLMEWTAHTSPVGGPITAALARVFPRTHRFMDLRRHAPHLRVKASAHIYGGRDHGIPEAHGRELSRLAASELLFLPEAPHLGSIKQSPRDVIGLALATFAKAESMRVKRVLD